MSTQLKRKNCVPYKKGTPPLSDNSENELLGHVYSWAVERGGVHRLVKNFDFNSFAEAVGFINTIAMVAEEERHHPSIRIENCAVCIELSTNPVLGLSENDFIMAAKIDGIYSTVTEPMIGVLESAML